MAVFISALISSQSISNDPRHSRGQCRPRAWYKSRYENSRVI